MLYYNSWKHFIKDIKEAIEKHSYSFDIYLRDSRISECSSAYIKNGNIIVDGSETCLYGIIHVLYSNIYNSLYIVDENSNYFNNFMDNKKSENDSIIGFLIHPSSSHRFELRGSGKALADHKKSGNLGITLWDSDGNGISTLGYTISKTKTKKRGNKMNGIGDLIKMKMIMKMLDGDFNENSLLKLSIVSSMMNGEGIDISEVMRTKLMNKFLINDKMLSNPSDDLPIEKLMIINMLNEGEFNMEEFLKMKMMTSLLTDDTSENKKLVKDESKE